jgi:tRNA dimethylallyltransferase
VNDDHITDRKKLLVLLGPTAVGKTNISQTLAKQYNCEIISADSMQVYRHMDIGTAKASQAELEQIPHHLIDICEPDQSFSVSDYQLLATQAIQDIHQRGKLPFIVGGTGLYIQSVCYEYEFTEGGADEAFRLEQRQFAEQYGGEALLDRLRLVDPETADRLHANDQRRVIRALEVIHLTGITMSEQMRLQKRTTPYNLILIGLNMDRAQLYERIEQRIDLMLEMGLVEEVRQLMNRGYTENMTSMQGLGYKEIMAYLLGRISYEEAVYLLKRDTRHYAKRQLSWFRRMKHIHWLDLSDSEKISENLDRIHAIIAGKFMMSNEYTWIQCES